MSLLLNKLKDRIKEKSQEFDGIIGVGVKDLTTDQFIELNIDEVFPAASIIKIPIIIEFFNQVELKKVDPFKEILYKSEMRTTGSGILKSLSSGKASLPLIDYVTLMTIISDNTATNILIDLLGIQNINVNLEKIGLIKTRLNRKMMNMELFQKGIDNITTPREMVYLLNELYTSKTLSKFSCEETIKMLKKPKEGLIQGVIRNSIKESIPVADKSGWVGGVLGDAGIVYLPNYPYIIAVFMKHISITDIHWYRACSDLTKITTLIHNYFEEVSSSTPEGRRRI
ncbi:serine hydrolase [Candidatus Bathyarchaeota archaeon]|nr:serine hydrolase [Candidatus Bathyarchaeota archaeon]